MWHHACTVPVILELVSRNWRLRRDCWLGLHSERLSQNNYIEVYLVEYMLELTPLRATILPSNQYNVLRSELYYTKLHSQKHQSFNIIGINNCKVQFLCFI